jgi:hypothetical protein
LPVSLSSSLSSNRALATTQGAGTQGSCTECSALKPHAVGSESRAGRPPYTKGTVEADDGEDYNADDTVGEDAEDFDEKDKYPAPIPQRVEAKRS